ncbi:acyl-CoA dehydrogenase family protein, partial [Streptomyces sp. 24-1644]|uniref:acyl-CoA dehydrogenase family protein n=1 Tax=Streptomyces sp. 24-1644 TaxID=3457315 RepID=UPI003FA6BF60
MGIGITEEHRALAQAVRGGLARAVPPRETRALLDAEHPPAPGTRPAHWDALAGQGLLGIHLPEEYGGGGGAILDLAVVLEEAAYASLPGPYVASVLTSAVLHRADVLDRGGFAGLVKALATGDRIGAAALGAGTLTAVESEGGHLLDGAAPPVLGGAGADLLLLAANSATGTLWFAVDAGTEGLTVRPHRGVDPTRPTAEVHARGVRVPAHRALATDTASVGDLAAALMAADACGTAARSLYTAVEHAKLREQFGRPIGRFQAVKHLCADMLVRLEQARALTWDAARTIDEASGGTAERTSGVRGLTAALAAATALDAAYSCAKDCIQILGGIGFTWEHDAHLQLRRAVMARQLLGAGDAHRLRAIRLAESGARRELTLELPAEAAAHRAEARQVLAAARGHDPR